MRFSGLFTFASFAGLIAVAPALAQSGTGEKPSGLTVEQAHDAIEARCSFVEVNRISDAGKAILRSRMVVSDRLHTRSIEQEINRNVDQMADCFARSWAVITDEFARDAATKAKFTEISETRATQRRIKEYNAIKDVFVSYGYRPSTAAPGPRFGFCEIADDYEVDGGYFEHHYVSRVFIDRDPENEIAPIKTSLPVTDPGTAAGRRVLNAMAEWAKARYKPPQERDDMRCRFFLTVQEAQTEWEAVKADKTGWGSGFGFIDTGVQ